MRKSKFAKNTNEKFLNSNEKTTVLLFVNFENTSTDLRRISENFNF